MEKKLLQLHLSFEFAYIHVCVHIHDYKRQALCPSFTIDYQWIEYIHLKLLIAWSLPSIATTTVRCLSAIAVFLQFCTGIKKRILLFFLSRISTALLGHVRMSHHLIQNTNMCQNFQQFTNRFTYWMRNVVSCTITVSKTLIRAVLGQWTRGSFKCCARVCFEILLL